MCKDKGSKQPDAWGWPSCFPGRSYLMGLRYHGILQQPPNPTGNYLKDLQASLRGYQLTDVAGLSLFGCLVGYQAWQFRITQAPQGPYSPLAMTLKELINPGSLLNLVQATNMENNLFEYAKKQALANPSAQQILKIEAHSPLDWFKVVLNPMPMQPRTFNSANFMLGLKTSWMLSTACQKTLEELLVDMGASRTPFMIKEVGSLVSRRNNVLWKFAQGGFFANVVSSVYYPFSPNVCKLSTLNTLHTLVDTCGEMASNLHVHTNEVTKEVVLRNIDRYWLRTFKFPGLIGGYFAALSAATLYSAYRAADENIQSHKSRFEELD
jgi:hypothetical protein